MLSRRLVATARSVPLRRYQPRQLPLQLPQMMQHVRSYADKIVQVPQMAESISEGTLKQWSKQVGDFVEQDEEIATIETDKTHSLTPCSLDRCRCQCPEAGTIKEFLVNEEDTVTVGQDIVKMELGGEKSSGSKDSGDKKEVAEKPKPESESKPEPSKTESKSEPKQEEPQKEVSASKPAPPAKETSKAAPAAKETAANAAPAFGSREERRVCFFRHSFCTLASQTVKLTRVS
ncbi:2-oxoglutarate dehydrogenase e2 component [Colletotrichum tofieldiae]|nr:2-oxoglutarate dehydrogenase e2 component [Colletotrichum tofieldiae]